MRWTCLQSRSLIVASCVLVLSACGGSGGGSSSPTEPRPTPSPTPAPLDGSWSGAVTLTTKVTCTLSLALTNDGGQYLGDWDAQCSDGKKGNGIAVANPLFFNQVLVSGLLGQPVFGGCGWASLAVRDGNRLRGDWSTPQGCQTGPVLQGQMELTKR
jgi:hypothetical protein